MTPTTAHPPMTDMFDSSGIKRKAETQDNERLSKRLSLLNIEKNGRTRLYVPVESPYLRPASPSTLAHIPDNESMQLDDSRASSRSPSRPASPDSKHKVYVYDLDEELADEASSAPATPPEGGLVIHPDVQQHLLRNRIPPRVLTNDDGDLAGANVASMQVVLYNDGPRSLTVPDERTDTVRRAILEARSRARSRSRGNSIGDGPQQQPPPPPQPHQQQQQQQPSYDAMETNAVSSAGMDYAASAPAMSSAAAAGNGGGGPANGYGYGYGRDRSASYGSGAQPLSSFNVGRPSPALSPSVGAESDAMELD